MICDTLDESSRSRLDDLMSGIDDNIEEIQREKEDYYSVD
jgi:hypothetical protein